MGNAQSHPAATPRIAQKTLTPRSTKLSPAASSLTAQMAKEAINSPPTKLNYAASRVFAEARESLAGGGADEAVRAETRRTRFDAELVAYYLEVVGAVERLEKEGFDTSVVKGWLEKVGPEVRRIREGWEEKEREREEGEWVLVEKK